MFVQPIDEWQVLPADQLQMPYSNTSRGTSIPSTHPCLHWILGLLPMHRGEQGFLAAFHGRFW